MATIKYKDPADGQWKVVTGGGGGQAFAQVSPTPPTPRSVGDIWVDTDDATFQWDTDWNTAALSSGWVADSGGTYAPPGYRKDIGNIVRLRGAVVDGTPGIANPIFTLDTGYRPAYLTQVAVVAAAGSTNLPATLVISASTGDVTVDATVNGLAPDRVYLDGITFGLG
jgi:hypothetical protein